MKTEAIVHHQAGHCLNCGAAAPASFCQYCGQETHAHVPGAGEYVHEFIGHYVALENKLWKTLVLLLFKPGRLTRDYIEGKRVRYVLPLRLYLTLSLVFFAVVKWDAHELAAKPPRAVVESAQKIEIEKAEAGLEAARKATGKDAAAGVANAQAALNAAKAAAYDKDAAHKVAVVIRDPGDHEQAEKFIGKLANKFSGMSWEQAINEGMAAFFGYLPYAIFALMPVFAMYLKLLYLGTGRRYGEHLLFALHTNAFAFLALTLMLALPHGIPYVRPALGLWLTFYLPTAMRKVYGGSRLATWVRWTILMFLHLLGMVAAVLGSVYLFVAS